MKYPLLLIVLILSFSTTTFAQSFNALSLINQKVCDRFEEDVSKLAAIMEEVRDRKGITETRVAFGGSDTPIKSADYYVNFAAEAVAYQRVQKPNSKASLKYSLETLKNKLLTAKNAVGKALDE